MIESQENFDPLGKFYQPNKVLTTTDKMIILKYDFSLATGGHHEFVNSYMVMSTTSKTID